MFVCVFERCHLSVANNGRLKLQLLDKKKTGKKPIRSENLILNHRGVHRDGRTRNHKTAKKTTRRGAWHASCIEQEAQTNRKVSSTVKHVQYVLTGAMVKRFVKGPLN